jgi:hypothetical protein
VASHRPVCRRQEENQRHHQQRSVEVFATVMLPECMALAIPTARPSSRIAPNTLGESKFGGQYQSIDPLLPTNAVVCMFPITP